MLLMTKSNKYKRNNAVNKYIQNDVGLKKKTFTKY